MSSVIIPENYDSKYGIMETEISIKVTKDFFEKELAKELGLTRISAPLFVRKITIYTGSTAEITDTTLTISNAINGKFNVEKR